MITSDTEQIFFNMKKQFLSMTRIDDILINLVGLTLSEEIQQQILSCTVCCPLALKFPPSKAYRKFFLKRFMKEVEKSGFDLAEELYTVYVELLRKPDDDNTEPYYCSYILNKDVIVTLQESKCLVQHSTTGLYAWEAGKYLIEWSIENSDLFKGRKILELGSGTGLTGIAICKLHNPATYIFTDCSPQVLQNLKSNIDKNIITDCNFTCFPSSEYNTGNLSPEKNESFMTLNCNSMKEENDLFCMACEAITSTGKKCSATAMDITQHQSCHISHEKPQSKQMVSIFNLKWELADKEKFAKLDSEIILAADVSYDPAIIKPFVHALSCFLTTTQRVAYVACAERNPETFKMLLDLISTSKRGLQYTILNKCKSSLFYYDQTVPIHLLKVQSAAPISTVL